MPATATRAFDALASEECHAAGSAGAADADGSEFVRVRRLTRLTDGNLASHAKRLQTGGLIEIDKQFRGSKPVTTFVLTQDGRKALEGHVRRLMSALSQRRVPSAADALAAPSAPAVRERGVRRTPVPPAAAAAVPTPVPVAARDDDDEQDDWVD